MKKFIPYLVAMLLLLASVSALELREGNEVRIKDELNENLFAAAGEISIDAPINGDVMAFGGDISINFPVTGGVHACGGDISINSAIDGDLMSGGGNININGNVNGDVSVIGGNVNINGNVAGDVLALAGNININGPVGGEIAVTGGNLVVNGDVTGDVEFEGGTITIDGVISGNVKIKADTIEFEEDALVKGNLDYAARNVILKEEQVEGLISKRIVEKKIVISYVTKTRLKVFGSLSLLLIGVILVLIMPNVSNKLSETIRQKPWMTLLYGLLALIVTPIAAVLIMITLIGIPVAILLLMLYGLAIAVSTVFAVLYVGKIVFENLKKPYKNLVLPMLAGGVIYIVLINIPYVGGLTKLLAMLFGLGAITSMIFVKEKVKKKKRKKK